MVTLLSYIIQVCGWFVPLYLLYFFFFKNYTFHHWNRWYLLLIGFLSFGLPFVHYTIVDNKTVYTTIQAHQQLPTQFIEKENSSIPDIISNTVQQEPASWTLLKMLAVLYLIGVVITGAKFLYGLFNIKRLILKAKATWTSNLSMVLTTDKVPHSSFFSYIFINKKTKTDKDLEKIIYHEMQHNEMLHSVDVLWCELMKVALWFNPLVYWYKKSLQEIHEFEVDAEMTKLYNKESYAKMLVKYASANFNKLINTFSSKPLKKRIIMLFNPKTYPVKKLVFLAVIPVIAVLLMAYGNIKHKTITTIRTINKPLTLVIDAGHGGTDKGVVKNSYNESALCLEYAKLLAVSAKEAGYHIVLTRSSDSLISLQDRVAITNTQSAAAFISIHFNAAKDDTGNGIEAYVANKEVKDSASENLANAVLQQTATLKGITSATSFQKRVAGIFVLKNATVPAALLELGYLSNKQDVEYVTKQENKQLIIDKIILGINNYFSNNSK